VFLYESMTQLVFVYPVRRLGAVPLPNVWIHVAVGLGVVVQALTVVLPPLRALLGLVPLSATLFGAIMAAVLLTWAAAEMLGRQEAPVARKL
jgi:P-type Ca2+ transporter type 2C